MSFYSEFNQDICFCMSKCQNKSCPRHPVHINWQIPKHKYYGASMADFRQQNPAMSQLPTSKIKTVPQGIDTLSVHSVTASRFGYIQAYEFVTPSLPNPHQDLAASEQLQPNRNLIKNSSDYKTYRTIVKRSMSIEDQLKTPPPISLPLFLF